MVLFNYATKELTAKIVYYGPGLCGKTTNLQYIHQNLPAQVKGKMLSLETKTDRTLFFDFLPMDLGEIRGMKTRVQLYTVPGQVFYNETRKLVLKGSDGIVFVADSQETMLGANVESFRNLEDNLRAHGLRLAEMPHVLQFNKRDLPRRSGVEQLNSALNRYNAPFYESVATSGIGVQDTLKAIVKLVLLHLTRKYEQKAVAALTAEAHRAAPAPPPATISRPPARSSESAASRGTIPVSSLDIPGSDSRGRELPPPPDFRARAGQDDDLVGVPRPDPFGDHEIEDLVDEVEEAPSERSDFNEQSSWAAADTPGAEVVKETTPEADSWEELPEDEAAPGASPPDAFQDGPLLEEPPAVESDSLGEDERSARNGLTSEVEEAGESESISEPEPEEAATEQLPDLVPLEEESPPEPISEPEDWDDGPFTPREGEFQVDRRYDPEWAPEPTGPPREQPATRIPVRSEPVEPAPVPVTPERAEGSAPLAGVSDDRDLFVDAGLEAARMQPGQVREIVVPVEVGEGDSKRRLKLSIRLALGPLDPP
jgi:signal recognition particle receptor subunit beta